MAKSNKDRISEALDYFVAAYRPFVIETLANKYEVGKKEATKKAQTFLEQGAKPGTHVPASPDEWDFGSIFHIILNDWQYNFRYQLNSTDRSMLHELKEVSNGWAHQKSFDVKDTSRALDTTHRLLLSIGAQKEAAAVDQLAQESMRVRFAEMERVAVKRAKRQPTQGTPQASLRPWRDVIIPHKDVREGKFTHAQFAADLAQVYRGESVPEYGDPKEFFRRTYLTDGLRTLISTAIQRFNGDGGAPVIELQTNFGGGKTHSMLALYHLCSGLPLADLTGVEEIARELDSSALPKIRTSVLVGTALTPGDLDSLENITPNTLWGLMALQLGGAAAYEIIRKADESGVAPGSDLLVKLFKQIAYPCLVLIDEWVAYCRQLWDLGNHPAGSFDTNLSFAQSLTEAAKACPQVLIVASLPASKVEVGGAGGGQALASLESTFGRIEFSWRPANQEESYEIVRRRLFEPMESADAFANRDATISAYRKMYRDNPAEFPQKANEETFYKRMESSYPIHPEMFDRLYNDWSTLQEFQRTRGVLRLMATVIHNLWMRSDSSVMIMPGLIPLDDSNVQEEFTRYLTSPWKVLVDKEVDGNDSLPVRIDKTASRFGQLWAARRAARTVFIGSAATEGTATKGLEIRSIRLGCSQPGENISIFGDALRQLGEQANHIYHDGAQYWLSTQPNVSNTARDRAAQTEDTAVNEAIVRMLQQNTRQKRGGFSAVHVCPEGSADVIDEASLRLVVLSPNQAHVYNDAQSPAIESAKHYLSKRGNSPRLNQNSLAFIAPDKSKLEDLCSTVRLHLAWSSITRDSEALDLSPYNQQMAKRKEEDAATSAQIRLLECYQWVIVPFQQDGTSATEWKSVRVQAGDHLAERCFLRLRRDGDVSDSMSALALRKSLDQYLWRNNDHVPIKQVQEDFARYLYLEKVTSPDVIIESLQEAISQWDEDIALAFANAEENGNYVGLVSQKSGAVISPDGLIVKYDAAQKQQSQSTPVQPGSSADPVGDNTGTPTTGLSQPSGNSPVAPKLPTRYFGEFSVPVQNPLHFSDVMKEVITHLSKNPSAKVTLSVNVDAELHDGFDEATQRIVRENSKTLGSNSSEFSDN